MIFREQLENIFFKIYPGKANNEETRAQFYSFVEEVECIKSKIDNYIDKSKKQTDTLESHLHMLDRSDTWYQGATTYGLYVDLFNQDFQGLIERLDYLQNLGISCLWLLPILDSPMFDQGFDIRDYSKIRQDLIPSESYMEDPSGAAKFREFVQEAHKRNIAVLIDLALNHTSSQHEWFVKALENDSKYRDYYIWSTTGTEYDQTRIIFSDVCTSNWEKVKENEYYFHRFLQSQPDLNYKNENVLFDMTRVFLFWLQNGTDAFRADAIPFLWKEEGTSCESLEGVHLILKFWRCIFDHVRSGTMMLAEACQKPKEVVEFFGNEDECQCAYNFPLMPQVFYSLAAESKKPIQHCLDKEYTPLIPESCQWFMFLRCHDELTLEMVDEQEREKIFDYYCKDKKWSFRHGSGVSARLSDLLSYNTARIQMANSILFSIIGTPILFYGDEFGMQNDEEFFKESYEKTQVYDTRYYNRGRVNWETVLEKLKNPDSQESKIFFDIQRKLKIRQEFLQPWIGNANVSILDLNNQEGQVVDEVLAYLRTPHGVDHQRDGLLCVHNLSATKTLDVVIPYGAQILQPVQDVKESSLISSIEKEGQITQVFDLLGKTAYLDNSCEKNASCKIVLHPFEHYWLRISADKVQFFSSKFM